MVAHPQSFYISQFIVLISCFACIALVTERCDASVLKSHKAVYRVKLETAAQGSGVSDASGAMMYKVQENCDSWSTETNINLKLFYVEKDVVQSDWSFVSREAKDGNAYQFRVIHSQGGSVIESYKGSVTREKASGMFRVQYFVPKEFVAELPSGTLFPIKHLMELISTGKKRGRIFSGIVFDGASSENPYEVNAVIGKERLVGVTSALPVLELFDEVGLELLPVRHVRMAFFTQAYTQAEPEFELGVDYRSDGIARSIKQDFGHFVLGLTPNSLEIFDSPRC